MVAVSPLSKTEHPPLLARLGSAHRPAVLVMAVPPAVCAASVVQRAVAVAARVPEDALGLRHREPQVSVPIVVRVREVQVHTRVEAVSIPVCMVVAHRAQALASASRDDVVLVHRARHTHPVEPTALPDVPWVASASTCTVNVICYLLSTT